MNNDFYKALIQKSPLSYACCKIINDENGKPIDLEFLEVNDAFEKITGLKSENILHKKTSEITNHIPIIGTKWISYFDQLSSSDDQKEFNLYSESVKRWFNMRAYCPEKNYMVVSLIDTTEKILSENALRESEERFRRLAENARDMIYRMSIPDGKYEYVSPASIEITGYTPEEHYQGIVNVQKCIHPDFLLYLSEQWENMLKGVVPPYYEYKITSKNGEEKWLSQRNVLVFDESGLPKAIEGVVSDITRYKQTEEQLRCSENKYRLLTESMQDVVWIMDTETMYFTYVSPSVKRLRGYTPEEIISQSIDAAVTPGDRENLKNNIRKNVKELKAGNVSFGKFDVSEIEQPCKDGSTVWTEVITSYYLNEKTGHIDVHGVTRNINERKLAGEVLRESESRFRSIIQNVSSVSVQGYSSDGTTRFWNHASEELYKYTEEEAIGKNLLNLIIPPEMRSEVMIAIRQMVETGEPIPASELSLMRKDGSRVDVFSSHSIVQKPGGEKELFCIDIDITERKRMEKMQHQIQKLESIGNLAGGIAHEFNNLMAGIFGYIDLASEESNNEKVVHYLSKATNNINRARRLTHELLTFSRGGAPVRKTGELGPFILEVSKSALIGSNILYTLNISEKLWQCSFDKDQISQVIEYIIINASEAVTSEGAIEISATNISFKEKAHSILLKGNFVRISIKDNGVGISKEILPQIFDPFFTTKEKNGGLGLAICHSIVKRHDGYIEVESEPGKGSMFHVYLPAVADIDKINLTAQPISPINHVKILIMDDEETLREMMADMFKRLGYHVVCVKDGREAVDLVIEHGGNGNPFSAIFLDMSVPGGMGGKDAVKEIRKLYGDIPVFIVSGYSDDPVMVNPREFGFTDSISKPFRKSELREFLNKYLNTKQMLTI